MSILTWIGIGIGVCIIAAFIIRYFIDRTTVIVYEGTTAVSVKKSVWTQAVVNGRSYDIKVVSNSKIGKLFSKMEAITIWNRIYTMGIVLSAQGFKHESCHVDQWHELGVIQFLLQYHKEESTNGYGCNKFEEQARAYAGQPSECTAKPA